MSAKERTEIEKAMDELDALAKSETTDSELDTLTKSLEAELGEDLSKSEKEDEDEEEEKEDGEEKEEKDEEAEPEEMEKSLADIEYEAELVKASELYADLTKSVQDGMTGINSDIDGLRSAVASLIDMNTSLARVVVSLSKSMSEINGDLKKSLGTMGAAPIIPNAARIGQGAAEVETDLKKSNSEIQDDLLKAVQGGKIAGRWLSDFGSYKDISRLPQEVRDIIGA